MMKRVMSGVFSCVVVCSAQAQIGMPAAARYLPFQSDVGVAFHASDAVTDNDVRAALLNGDVKAVVAKQFGTNDEGGWAEIPSGVATMAFDECGNLKTLGFLSTQGAPGGVEFGIEFTTEYDEDGCTRTGVTLALKSPDGFVRTQPGLIERDDQGRLVRLECGLTGLAVGYAEDKVDHLSYGGPARHAIKQFFDAETGRLKAIEGEWISAQFEWVEDGSLVIKHGEDEWTLELDEHGNPTRLHDEDRGDLMTWAYEFDEQGNWIEMITNDQTDPAAEGHTSKRTERTIVYRDEGEPED